MVSLVPRPFPASFLVAYVTFDLPSDMCLSERGSKVTYVAKNEAGDSLGTRLVNGHMHA